MEEQIQDRVLHHRATSAITDDASPAEDAVEPSEEHSSSSADMDMSFLCLTAEPAPSPTTLVPKRTDGKRPRKEMPAPKQAVTQPLQPPSVGRSRSSSPSSLRSTSPARKPQDLPVPAPATQSSSKAVQKAEKLMKAKGSMLSDKALWDSKPKTRQVESAAKALEDAASQLLGRDEPDVYNLMQSMLELAEKAPKANDLFIRLRKSPKEFISYMSVADLETWSNVSVAAMEAILTSTAMLLLNQIEQDSPRVSCFCLPVLSDVMRWCNLQLL